MFTIYSADVTGNPGNCSYPYKHVILDEDSLKAAICHDYVCAEYKNTYRNGDNFIDSDSLPVDCDNDHSENPEDWVCPNDILQAFPDVSFAIHYSRYNNLAKNGKAARPKFHVLFPIEYVSDASLYSDMKEAGNDMLEAVDKLKNSGVQSLLDFMSKNITSALKKSRPILEISSRDLDADCFALCTPEASYDLRKGMAGARKHLPEDFITKITSVSSSNKGQHIGADCLDLIFQGDQKLIDYAQMICGLAAIGKVYVESLIIAHIHGVVFDELHTQPNRKLFDVMPKGSGDSRTQPLYFLITTAGTDTNSICYETHQKVKDILESMGFTVVPFGHGFKDISSPTKELMKLTLEQKLAHGGHPVLRWIIDNIYNRTDPAGNVKAGKEKSTEKNDGAVAMIMALDRAIHCRNSTGTSVYDDRGILFI